MVDDNGGRDAIEPEIAVAMIDDDGPDPVEPEIAVDMAALPPSVSGAQPGVALQVHGTLVTIRITSYSVKVRVGARSFPATVGAAAPNNPHVRPWTCLIRFYDAGAQQVVAEAQGGQLSDETPPETVTVTLASGLPDLTIDRPQPGPVNVGEAGELLALRAITSDQFGPRSVRWEYGGAGGYAVQDAMAPTVYNGEVPFGPQNLGNQTITVRCRDGGGNERTRTVTVQGMDVTPPHVSISQPQPNQAFVASAGAVTIAVRGITWDVQSGMSGGRVEWSLDGSSPFTAATTVDSWANWEAQVPIAGFGAYTVVIRAVDAAGNTVDQQLPVQVVSSYRPADLLERLDPRQYLAALLANARDHVRVPDQAGGRRQLSTADLQNLLSQPFGRLSQPLSAAGGAGSAPINELRVPIEVVRATAGALPALLGGRWTFDVMVAGQTTANDVSGNGNPASLLGGAAIAAAPPGGPSGKAVSFDGANAYLEVAHSATLAFADDNADFTVTFWLFLRSWSPGEWLAIGRKGATNEERTFALFLQPDKPGVHARISTTANWNDGLDGGTPLQVGRWAHLAYVKAGAELRLYVDGALDGRTTVNGDVVSNTAPITFGKQPWYDSFDGMLDDVRVYRLALGSDSVRAVMASGTEAAPLAQQAAAEGRYRQRAYEALLVGAGAGYDEVRLAATADGATRTALAARLGIRLGDTRPDQLDQLTLDPAALTESTLEALFGLADTDPTKDVLRTPQAPALLSWRLTEAALRWSEMDRAHDPDRAYRVLVDPDLVGVEDLEDPSPGAAARTILDARVTEVAGFVAALRAARSGLAPDAAWQALLADALPNVSLSALAAARDSGTDIGAQLKAIHLTPAAFGYLLHIAALVQVGTVTDAEWQETEDVLVQAKKEARYADWRAAESAIALTPEHFRIGLPGPAPSRWRAPAKARRQWVSILAGRVDQRQAILDGYWAMVAQVEQLVLPSLRDAVLTGWAGATVGPDVAAWLTERYQVDVATSGALLSTRIDQAVQSVQATLFALRAGRLPRAHPAAAWSLDSEQGFDQDWRWIGSYDGWRAATLAYLYPENLLLPSLRSDRSQPFADLLDALTSRPGLTPADARALASDFLAGHLPQLYQNLPAPTAVWSFDENGGPTVADSAGGATGTLVGGAAFARGQFGAGLVFDGRDDRVAIARPAPLNALVNTFTISFWVRPDAAHEIDLESTSGASGTTGQRYAYGPLQGQTAFGDTNAGVGVSVGTNGISVYEHSDGYLPAVLVWTGQVDGWTHVAVVYEDRVPRLYVNGVQVRSRSQPSPQAYVHAAPDGLGGMAYGYLRGGLDEVRVYPAALVPEQIQLLSFRLTDQRTDEELQRLADLNRRLLTPYAQNTPPYLAPGAGWLTEIFYSVPVLMALRLQTAGEYLAALDWLQNVYAYHLPPDRRKIYYGFQLERNAPLDLRQAAGWVSHLNPHVVATGRPNPYTRFTLVSLARCCADFGDAEFTRDTGDAVARARGLYTTARTVLDSPELVRIAAADAVEPALPDPSLDAVRTHVSAQLVKLRQGRNIAGLPRVFAPPPATLPPSGAVAAAAAGPSAASAAVRPSAYHYRVLVERTKQLAALAEQTEAAYLSALEKFDQADFRRFQADQGLELARAGVELHRRRVEEAAQGITLANAQQAKVEYVADEYLGLIAAGLNRYERSMLDGYSTLSTLRTVVGGIDAAVGLAQAAMQVGSVVSFFSSFGAQQVAAGVATTGMIAKAVVGGFINAAEAQLQSDTLLAGYERRREEWQLQYGAAQQDGLIAEQQVVMAADHYDVALQEAAIAATQVDQAHAVVDFLDRQFASRELYEWMSGVLAGVYRYFLQQATALARTAQDQLAFERQEPATTFIQSDYWQQPAAPSTDTTTAAPDRRGLTGSARLMRDIYQLDQHAFATEKRKLNLSQTFSLAQLLPLEFQLFRQTGVLRFATPMRWFDVDFPGHYLRLIKRVRLSVPALIPPSRGLRAQLLNSGISRVTTGTDFREATIRRDPDVVALTSAVAATGVFELDVQADLLYPFEAIGVDTNWELQLPRAANPFDFNAIADVLVTVDYTALYSDDYRSQVVARLNATPRRSGDRALSLRRDFPDAWYDLLNPATTATDRTVTIVLDRADVPSNLDNAVVDQVVLFAVAADRPDADALPTMTATIQHQGTGGAAELTGGLASTRRGNAPAWSAIAGTPVTGAWRITLPLAGPDWDGGAVDDLLLVIGYAGDAPAWPT